MSFGDLYTFQHVFLEEIDAINKRRADESLGRPPIRPPIQLEPESVPLADGTYPLRPTEDSRLVGLALSGGGIRSAAVCLGALQALEERGVFGRVDYLSTVSGGGYIGTSLCAAMQAMDGRFPFSSRLSEDEPPAIQHIRDYSNYLFPPRSFALLHNVSIYARGLVANFILIMPLLLIGAAVTIIINPTIASLKEAKLGNLPIVNITGLSHFVVTTYLGCILLASIILWALARSRLGEQRRTDVPSRGTTYVGWLVILVFVSAFFSNYSRSFSMRLSILRRVVILA